MTTNLYSECSALHYNVHFRNRSVEKRVMARAICGLRPMDIVWIWIVELRRRATRDEIRNLCKLVYEI